MFVRGCRPLFDAILVTLLCLPLRRLQEGRLPKKPRRTRCLKHRSRYARSRPR